MRWWCWRVVVAAAAAEGPGGEAPTDYTKPQQTIQNPIRLYKAPKGLHKAPTDNTKTENIRRNPKRLDKNLRKITREANNASLHSDI